MGLRFLIQFGNLNIAVETDNGIHFEKKIMQGLNDSRQIRKSKPTIYKCQRGGGNGIQENMFLMRNVLPEYQIDDLSTLSFGDKLYETMPKKYLDAGYTNEYDVFIV